MVVRHKWNDNNAKNNKFNSVAILPYVIRHQRLAAARPTYLVYIDGRKHYNSLFCMPALLLHSHADALKHFGCFVT